MALLGFLVCIIVACVFAYKGLQCFFASFVAFQLGAVGWLVAVMAMIDFAIAGIVGYFAFSHIPFNIFITGIQ